MRWFPAGTLWTVVVFARTPRFAFDTLRSNEGVNGIDAEAVPSPANQIVAARPAMKA
jgi:hypothetical protein